MAATEKFLKPGISSLRYMGLTALKFAGSMVKVGKFLGHKANANVLLLLLPPRGSFEIELI